MSSNDFDYEDMVDGEAVDTDAEQTTGNIEGTVQQQQEEIAPVKLSKGKALAVVIVFIVLVIFILKVLDGVSLTKNTGTPVQNQEVQSTTEENNTASAVNGGDSVVENSDNSAVSSEVESTSSEISNIENNVGSESNTGVGVIEGEIVESKEVEEEVQVSAEFEHLSVEPVMGSEVTVSGIVKGISMYRVGSSYTYGVNLILVVGNDTNIECTYFCPKKTADALDIGTSLNVIYQSDSAGNICVVSISK